MKNKQKLKVGKKIEKYSRDYWKLKAELKGRQLEKDEIKKKINKKLKSTKELWLKLYKEHKGEHVYGEKLSVIEGKIVVLYKLLNSLGEKHEKTKRIKIRGVKMSHEAYI